jgi:glycosyltransferase involved in cell wall biosynthesis
VAVRIAIVMNTYESRAESGGFVHLFQGAKRWRDMELTVFAPELARSRVSRELPEARFVAIPSCETVIANRAAVYLFRTLAAASLLPKRLRSFDAIYVLSPSLPDIVPAVVASPDRTVAQVFHLQAPPWKRPGSVVNNVFAFASEWLGVALVRRFVRNVVVLTSCIEPALRLSPQTRVTPVGSGTWTGPVEGLDIATRDRAGAVYVGRLHPAKGLDDVVDAWAVVHAHFPDAALTLVGSGDESYLRTLRSRIERLNLGDCVRLAGFVTEKEKAQILAGARVFVSASKEEGWGISIAEALALGVPCVTYDLPVFREVFPEGRIGVPTGNVPALAEAITVLLQDDGLREILSAGGRKLAAKLSWDSVADREAEAIRFAVSAATEKECEPIGA